MQKQQNMSRDVDSLDAQARAWRVRLGAQKTVVKIKMEKTADLESVAERPLGRLVFDIVSYLKTLSAPVSAQNILENTSVDVMASTPLLEALRSNPRIECVFRKDKDPKSFGLNESPKESYFFAYRATHDIGTAEKLLALLHANAGVTAIEVRELRESNEQVMLLVDKLVNQNLLLTITNKDGSIRVVYPESSDEKIRAFSVGIAVRDLWADVDMALPPPDSIADELTKAGLKPIQIFGAVKKRNVQTKNKRKSRFKLTNTHLVGVDLRKDFVLDE